MVTRRMNIGDTIRCVNSRAVAIFCYLRCPAESPPSEKEAEGSLSLPVSRASELKSNLRGHLGISVRLVALEPIQHQAV